jgi:copper(I)-binding protein
MESTTTMGAGSTMGSDGMMTMRPVERIVIPAGRHCLARTGRLPRDADRTEHDRWRPEAAITITLIFEQAGEIEVEADVRDTAP